MQPESIRLAELRSLALHRRVAERIREHPELLTVARQRVATWLGSNHPSREYFERWRALLERPLDEVLRVLVADSEASRELRGATPFAGLVDPRERWAIWEDVRRAAESERA